MVQYSKKKKKMCFLMIKTGCMFEVPNIVGLNDLIHAKHLDVYLVDMYYTFNRVIELVPFTFPRDFFR